MTVTNHFDYVGVYDNILPKTLCDEIITRFENRPDIHEQTYLEKHRSFTEINITKQPDWKDIQDKLFQSVQFSLGLYVRDFGIDEKSWPEKTGYEQFRMKRYLPNTEDEFRFHVDVQDYASARRYLVVFFYLNDVEQGGETAFQLNRYQDLSLKVQPKAGRAILFPPLWTHPHLAIKPISGPKYIVGSYLHYV